jgi:hypothetical protein
MASPAGKTEKLELICIGRRDRRRRPSERSWNFESSFFQRRVCKPSVLGDDVAVTRHGQCFEAEIRDSPAAGRFRSGPGTVFAWIAVARLVTLELEDRRR